MERGSTYRREITREQFESLIQRHRGPHARPVPRVHCAMRGSTVEQIDEVVLVGGSTRIPLVRQAVENLFRARPHTELNPDEVVALGAAVQAGILTGRRARTSCCST